VEQLPLTTRPPASPNRSAGMRPATSSTAPSARDTSACRICLGPVEVLSLKPANLSVEEAAAVPMVGSPPCSRVWAAAAAARQALVPGQLRAASLARQSPASSTPITGRG